MVKFRAILWQIVIWFFETAKAPIEKILESEAVVVVMCYVPWMPKWITKTAVKMIFKYGINPEIDAAFREIGYAADVHDGKLTVKRIENATSVSDWGTAIDSGMQSSNH